MKVQQFLSFHGIQQNPFGQEDAQTDPVFQGHCIEGTHHPAWDKILGSPAHPATAVVFGEKGSGKTALRLQMVEQLKRYNRDHPEDRVFVIEYDDFNPFLDCYRQRLPGRSKRHARTLENWRLWDHMDAILSLGVTRAVDLMLRGSTTQPPDPFGISRDRTRRLTRPQRRDLLLMAAFYDHSVSLPVGGRWRLLRRRLRFGTLLARWDLALGVVVTFATLGLLVYYNQLALFRQWWPLLIIVACWMPWLWRQARLLWQAWRVSRQVRVIDHQPNSLRQILSHFRRSELAGQPMPALERSDDRYELLMKLQSALGTLGFGGILVLVDRVDEPHLVNGSPERMRDLLWPMFDNKFLKHPGLGVKLLLPIEVSYYLNREGREFYERSRLDKQNLIPSLEWSGESLYDLANDRIRACSDSHDGQPTLRRLFDESISDAELISTLDRLRVPRHLFKFLYQVLVEHCQRYTEEEPRWTIGRETFQSTLALYLRDLEAFDRGMGTG